MRNGIRLIGLGVGLALAGCATESEPPPPAYRAPAVSREQAAAQACARAEANPADADPGALKRCRGLRWRYSGIMCTDNRVGDRVVEVTCAAPFHGGYPDSRTSFEMIEQRAAVATLAAGFTHLVFSGEQAPEPQYPAGQAAPRTCQRNIVFGPPSWTCTSDVQQPASIIFRHRYEMLTETEALGRINPEVPPPRQPRSAVEVTQAYAP